jgi:hypothetical protein
VAFQVINSNEIEVGDPIKAELFSKIKNSLDDLNSRTTAVEVGSASIDVFDFTVLNASASSTFTGMAYYRAKQNFTLTGCEIQIFEKGSLTGTLEVDVKKNSTPDDTGMSSVFTTKPSLVWASISDYAVSTNQVFDATKIAITSGTILRFDITSMPGSGVLGKFRIQLYGEVG